MAGCCTSNADYDNQVDAISGKFPLHSTLIVLELFLLVVIQDGEG